MDRVRIGPVKGLRIAVAAFVLSVFLFVAVIGGGIYLATHESGTTKQFSTELRDGLVRSCERNGNPLREAVRAQILTEIRQRSSFDYGRFFPNVPKAELARLLAEQDRIDRATLVQIAPVNCEQLYPKP